MGDFYIGILAGVGLSVLAASFILLFTPIHTKIVWNDKLKINVVCRTSPMVERDWEYPALVGNGWVKDENGVCD